MSAVSSDSVPARSRSCAATPRRPSPDTCTPAAVPVTLMVAPWPNRPSRSATTRPGPKPGSGSASSPSWARKAALSGASMRRVPATRSSPDGPPIVAAPVIREAAAVPSAVIFASASTPAFSATRRSRSGPSVGARAAIMPGRRPGTSLRSSSASGSTRRASIVASSRPPEAPTRPLARTVAPPTSVMSSVSTWMPSCVAERRSPTRPAPTFGPVACPTRTFRASMVSSTSTPRAAPVTVDRSGTWSIVSPSAVSCASKRPRFTPSGSE